MKILNRTPPLEKTFPCKWTEENCSKFDQKKFDMKCLELSNELKVNPMNTIEIYRELLTIRNSANNSGTKFIDQNIPKM